MTTLGRSVRALPITFAIYVAEALLAASFALPPSVELAPRLSPAWDPSRRAVLIDQLAELASLLRLSGLDALFTLGALVLLGAWLQMSWFSALARPTSALAAFSEGAARFGRALYVSLLVGVSSALALAVCGGLAYGAHMLFAESPDARSHDLAVGLCLGPLLPLAVFAHALHDLARACALDERAFRSVVRALRAACSGRVQARALGFALLGTGLVAAAQAAAQLLGEDPLGFVIAAVLLQSALFARLFLRSIWLASALACVAPTPEAKHGA